MGSPRGERKPGAGGMRPVLTATEEHNLMPQNVMAEEGVLGSVLIDPEAIHEVRRILSPDDFYKEAHRLVFEAALELADEGTPTDIILVGDTLAKHGRLEDVGGYAAISTLASLHVPSSKNATHYARIVRTASLNRQIIHATADVAAAGYTVGDPAATVEYAEARIAEIREELRRLEGGPRFRLKSIEEMRTRARPQWLIPSVLQERKLWLIFGASNTGKSFVALDLLLCMATGTPWRGKVMSTTGHVVYVCAEGLDGIRDRIDAWLAAHNMEDAPLFHVIDESPNLLEMGDVSEVIAQVQTLDAPPIAVCFDTLASSMDGGDENSPEDMGKAVGAMRRVQRECNCAVMTVHHSGKDTTKGARGHTSLRGAMDTAIEVSKDEETRVITLHCDKQRDEDYFDDMGMRLRSIWLDAHGDITSCVAEPTDLVAKSTTPFLPKSAKTLLAIMQANPSALSTHADLKRKFIAAGMSERSFNNALATLEHRTLAENFGGSYRLTPAEAPADG